ncbi:hypothetical protein BBK82_13600 [Lentzea guizhouensis]|uniref:Uncharacterized protein n=2 Tax=Lentzea guizhouensis TaxID=1586287 RepID=A0A1B2HGY0_9PSEU|nr:hypothetical protein BBK82_13600 [Lentzea guizhouensis]
MRLQQLRALVVGVGYALGCLSDGQVGVVALCLQFEVDSLADGVNVVCVDLEYSAIVLDSSFNR